MGRRAHFIIGQPGAGTEQYRQYDGDEQRESILETQSRDIDLVSEEWHSPRRRVGTAEER